MKINNISIQGVFKYSKNLEFEKGDFIIYNGVLYTCTGANPEEKLTPDDPNQTNFNVYLGDRITTADEYFKYIDYIKDNRNREYVEDKYVSSHALSEILNHYLFGVNEKGVITEWIKYDGNGIVYSKGLEEILGARADVDVLDEIFYAYDELNNVLLKVDPLAVPRIVGEGTENYRALVKDEFVIFRQYTINVGDGKIQRCQELINPLQGTVWYRGGNVGDGNATIWRSSFYYGRSDQGDVKYTLDYLYDYYRTATRQLRITKENLENTFHTASLNVYKSDPDSSKIEKLSSITIHEEDMGLAENTFRIYKGYGDLYTSGLGDRLVLDIVIRRLHDSSNNIYLNSSITIDLGDSLLEGVNETSYAVGTSGIVLKVSRGSNNTVDLRVSSPDGNITEFSSIYYRKYFNSSDYE